MSLQEDALGCSPALSHLDLCRVDRTGYRSKTFHDLVVLLCRTRLGYRLAGFRPVSMEEETDGRTLERTCFVFSFAFGLFESSTFGVASIYIDVINISDGYQICVWLIVLSLSFD